MYIIHIYLYIHTCNIYKNELGTASLAPCALYTDSKDFPNHLSEVFQTMVWEIREIITISLITEYDGYKKVVPGTIYKFLNKKWIFV